MTVKTLDHVEFNAPLTVQFRTKRPDTLNLHDSEKVSSKKWAGPKTLTIQRGLNGFGFSLRYFAVQPLASNSPTKGFHRNSYWLEQGLAANEIDDVFLENSSELDIFFAKIVEQDSPADKSGLQQGDRIISINGDLIGGKTYREVVELIQYCDGELKLGVIPQDQDVLQKIYKEFLPDENRLSDESLQMSLRSANKWAVQITPRKPSTNESTPTEEKRYDPCVSFVAGTAKITVDQRTSGSYASSGSHTPVNYTPSRRSSSNAEPEPIRLPLVNDPCISWVGGMPVNRNTQKKDEKIVTPQSLNTALRREVSKKSFGTRLAPKMISGVSKPGAVSNMKELFSGNSAGQATRKNSATSVLRDDFKQIDMQRQLENCKENNPLENSCSVKLSTQTSKATLVQSEASKSGNRITVGLKSTFIIKPSDNQMLSPPIMRRRNLISSSRKMSLPSSVENSEDDDVDSENEHELNNWKDRRTSYLQAKDTKKSRQDMEADDEDSDTACDDSRLQQKSGDDEARPVLKEGPLNRKLERSLDRKKASSRTWKPVYAVLKGHRLFCYKAQGSTADDDIIQPIPLRSSIIEIASDYVKRRHVIRMVTSHGNEYLFQAEDTAAMMSWVQTLRDANPDKESLSKSSASVRKEKTQDGDSPPTSKVPSFKEKKGISIKRSHFTLRSKKSRNSNTAPPKPTKRNACSKTFGIPIEECPPAKNAKNVPLIVEHCCNVIGSKGKELVGVYRIPGNAGTVQALQNELDTKDPKDINWDEEKWYEINNIGSLLKSFLRNIPEPIIHNSLYGKLLESNHVIDPSKRLLTIKNVIWALPETHFFTLQFLVDHLRVIANNSDKNKMDPKNLALVFGPTIVRTSDANLASMVKDMSDQCKIIETLILLADWMFAEGDVDPPEAEKCASELICATFSRGMMECLSTQQQGSTTEEADSNGKKKSFSSSLKSNISMKLRNNSIGGVKVISPKSVKKNSKTEPPEWHADEDTDGDTSGCSSQSPPVSAKFKSKAEGRRVALLPNSGKTSVAGTKVMGSFLKNSHLILQYNNNQAANLPSPDDSPLSPRKNNDDKSHNNDDGNDSGVMSPVRIDSDDNTSESGRSRKESFESLSPQVARKFQLPIPRQLSGGSSNDERSPTLPKSKYLHPEDSPKVKKRVEMRRNKRPNESTGKRDLYSILPGDGNNYEDKILALLEADRKDIDSCTGSSKVEGLCSSDDLHADWWLSGNLSPKIFSPTKEKALSIISNAIDSKNRRATNKPQLSARAGELKQKKELLDKKVSNLLGSKSPPLLSKDCVKCPELKSPSHKNKSNIDEYLQQVSELLKDCAATEDFEEERNSLNNIINRARAGATSEITDTANPIPSFLRSKSSNPRYTSHRNSPFLDMTYSNLNYSKLYPK